MATLNKVMLIGRLGHDPDVKTNSGGLVIASFSMATSEVWKDKSGEKQEKTEWHKVVAFGRLAEICGAYLSKGGHVFVEGRIQTDKYEQDGVTKYATKIIANNIQMLGGKSQKTEQPKQQENNVFCDDDIPF